MQLAEDLKRLLTDFKTITLASQRLEEENLKLKNMLQEKEKKLVESMTLSSKLEKDLQKKQNMLELVHQQLVVIPELRSKVVELSESLTEVEEKIELQEQESIRLKQKHLTDFTSLKEEIEKERQECREEENRRMSEMEEFFRQAQETELASLEKKGEREKHVIVDQLRKVEEEMRKVKAEHEDELEMMKVQIVSAKGKANQAQPNNAEIYRKKMMAMQEHYEKQIQDLVTRNQTTNTSNTNIEEKVNPEPGKKKRKVSFGPVEFSGQTYEVDKRNTHEIGVDDTEDYESIFAVAANKFSNKAKPDCKQQSKEESTSVDCEVGAGTWWMGNHSGQEKKIAENKKQEKLTSQTTSAWGKERVQSRFKFSHINSGVSGGVSEFGKFSTVQRGESQGNRGAAVGGSIGGLSGDRSGGGLAGGRTGGYGQDHGSSGGMKRKLFSETAGPQVLD